MDPKNLKQQLNQIELHAQMTLAEFPSSLTMERQRMIVALVRRIRSGLASVRDPDATVPADDNRVLRSV